MKEGEVIVAKVIEQVSKLLEPLFTGSSYNLYDLEYIKEGSDWFLRVFADKEGGITLDDCVNLSEQISEILDSADPDPIPHAYFLEVSSPGAERPLKNEEHLKEAIGHWVHLNLYQAFDGKKEIEGRLKAVNTEQYIIEIKDKTRNQLVEIPRKIVSLIRLAIEF